MYLALGFFTLLSPQTTSAPRLPARAPTAWHGPNIVLIVADDCGVDLIGAYGEGSSPACTPNIDRLAADGLLFRNAWANPVCSPSRAALLTGRHGFRTGIGSVVANTDAGLALSENTLPEMLSGYESACVGKWHLAGNQGTLHPNNSGFGYFAGSVRGALTSYTQWTKVIDGQSSMSTTYATTDTANEAVAAMSSMNAPWFLNVNFNAPHAPYHVPPAALCSTSGCANPTCGNLPMNPSNLQLGKAMLEALDAEIGRVVAALDALDPDALVVFIGDNGTAQAMSQAPFLPGHAKDTVYEGGVNVPLIVRGRGVVHAECDALVSAVDLFATLAELARVPSATEDSVSMVPYFRNPRLVLRETVYAETFSPNGGAPPFASHERAVRNARYKLIRRSGQADLFFDLMSDPFEATNLFGALTASEQLEYDALEAELIALGVG